MIDYKIRNRANRVVLKCAVGGTVNARYMELATLGYEPSEIRRILQDEGYSMVDVDNVMTAASMYQPTPAPTEVTETASDPTRKEIRAQRIADRRDARQQNQDQRLHDKFARQTYGNGAKYNSETGTYQVLDKTTGELVDATSQPLEGDFEQWQSDRQASTQNMVGQLSNAALGVANQVIDSSSKIDQQSSFGSAFQSGWDSASDLVGKINPMWGAIAKGAGTVMKAVDNIFATDSDSYSVDDRLVADLGGSYGGTVSQMEDAASRAGKYGGLFSNGARRRANKAISKAKHNQSILNDINQVSRQQQDLVNQMGDQSSNAYQFDLTGGYKQQYMRAAKEGGVIEEKFVPVLVDDMIVPKRVTPGEFMNGGVLKEIINPESGGIVDWEPELVEWAPILVDSFKPGGKIEKALDAPETEETEQKSVIPEGSLHKDKHHMENTEGMTKKGIPVVDDDSKQQAEIERNEIIFTKEVTKKLEELYAVYYDGQSTEEERDQAAIDAGKLLTREIMLNTDDRTGLIDTLKRGGKVQDGGKVKYKGRSLDDLVAYAKEKSPRFIQRMDEFPMIVDVGDGRYGSHQLSYATDSDENPTRAWIYPEVMEIEDGDGLRVYTGEDAMREAQRRGDWLEVTPDEAAYFTEHYKEAWPEYMKSFDEMEKYMRAHPDADPVMVRKMFMAQNK